MDTKNLVKYIQSEKNVLFTGAHGVGKTTMVMDAAKEANVKCKYFSAATLDPWADLIGIPCPVGPDDNKKLLFIRPTDIDDAEMVFFDEINRSHPKVRNAVLEMIQFKTINGVPLPNLRLVWAAMNPAGGKYQVEELDPALVDRFHIQLEIKANPDIKYFTRVDKNTGEQLFNEREAECLVGWWNGLTKEAKALISPRRLEYFGTLIKDGIHPKLGIPLGITMNIPVPDLLNRFNLTNTGKWNMDQIAAATPENFQQHISNRSNAIDISNEICSARITHLAINLNIADKILMLPKEIRQRMYNDSSFRAKIQNKYSSTWKKAGCPEEIKKMIIDSHNLENSIVDFKEAKVRGEEIKQLTDKLHEDVLAAGKNLRQNVVPVTPPTLKDDI